jgi:uncharacterized protein (TIGR02246 family)
MRDNDGTSELRDALAIRALCERYAQAVDAGDGAAFAGVFTPDGHLASDYYGGHYNGREEQARIPDGAKEYWTNNDALHREPSCCDQW